MILTLQVLVGCILASSFSLTVLYWRITKLNPLLTFIPIFTSLLFVQVLSLLSWTIFVVPKKSSLRHLPLAPQKPWHQRLLKEPNAFHFERWINEVPNDGLIRYFGAFNAERVLATSPQAIREVLHLKTDRFEKQYSHKTHLKLLSSDSLVTVEGSVHKFQRKTINPVFWTRHVNEIYYPLFWRKAGEMIAAITSEKEANNCCELEHGTELIGKSKAVDDLISRAVFDIMGEAAFDQDLQCLKNPDFFHNPSREFRQAFHPTGETRTRMLLGLLLPTVIVDRLPIAFNMKIRPGLDAAKKHGIDTINSKRAMSQRTAKQDLEMANAPEQCEKSDLLGKIMDMNQFDDQTLLNQFMMLLTGGTHTSIAIIKSAIWFLAQSGNLHMQERLRQEVREVLPSPDSQELDIDKFREAPYLVAVRDEVLRLHSAFSTTGRQALEPVEICGAILPAGVPVSISPWAVHRSVGLWGSDAKIFDPTRWLSGNAHRRPHENGSHIPFGIGPRVCIGEAFAKAEINCLLAALFGRFQLEFTNDQQLPRVTHQVTVAFKDDIRVRITRIDGW